MTREQGNALEPGLYILYWQSGGSSLAAVGQNHYGDTWYTPTNWVGVPSYNWRDVARVERIDARSSQPTGSFEIKDLPDQPRQFTHQAKQEARAG
jgi:hypothetical protein